MSAQLRTVICGDAVSWLREVAPLSGSSLVASLPDISEFPQLSLTQWKTWFLETALLVLSRCPDEGATFFYQSDIKHSGEWVDKAYLCQRAAENAGHRLLWHKILCRAPAGVATFGRPGFSHLLCFSKTRTCSPERSTPDVIPRLGEKVWERGMGLEACLLIARFIKDELKGEVVINPFCGMGTMLAASNALGLRAIGIERGPKRARMAQKLLLTSDLKGFQ